MPAVKGQLEYQVRYRSQNSNGGWKIVDVDKGLSITIDELKNGLLYSFEIRKICYPESGQFKLEGAWITIKSLPIRALANGVNCDTLGQLEIIPGNGFTASFLCRRHMVQLFQVEDCNPMHFI